LRTGDGRPLGPFLVRELTRQFGRRRRAHFGQSRRCRGGT
jgi:hypothetical protein